MSKFYIGISGWRYPAWRDDFYPVKLPQRRELEYASRVLNSLEINGTFYSLQSPKSFQQWAIDTPDDFVFSVKGPRFITHIKRLRDVQMALANLFANGVLKLANKLGPFLWQLPPKMKFEPETVAEFCRMLPKDAQQAADVASGHNDKVKGKCWFEVENNFPLYHAFEPRDPSFLCETFIRILRDHGHALVFAETGEKYPAAEDLTADFVYIRMHGSAELYSSQYGDEDLLEWKRRIERWASGGEVEEGRRISQEKPPPCESRNVYIYFDNDAKGHSPFDALRLSELIGIGRDLQHLTGIDGKPLPPPPRLAKE